MDGRIAKMMVTIMRIPPVKRYTINSKFCAAVWELKRKDNLGTMMPYAVADSKIMYDRDGKGLEVNVFKQKVPSREQCYPNS